VGRKRIEIIIETERVILTRSSSSSSHHGESVSRCERCDGWTTTQRAGDAVRKSELNDTSVSETVRAQSTEHTVGDKCVCVDEE
jgi:hypothetical protein